jgi:hypothetical protein
VKRWQYGAKKLRPVENFALIRIRCVLCSTLVDSRVFDLVVSFFSFAVAIEQLRCFLKIVAVGNHDEESR